jgi:[ribosomal protein S5]-alanine N-acetyltransferase
VFGFLKSDADSRPTIELAGAEVYLRPPQASDWRAWAELRAASRAFLEPWEPRWAEGALTRAAFRRRLRRQAREARDDTGYSFFILRRDDDALVGGINLSNVQRGVAMSCSVGYWIGMEYARQGLMGDGLEALLPFVFKKLSLHRLEAACLPTNLPSEGLLRKLGFQREGYARRYLRINGEWQDHLLFALLAEDFVRITTGHKE